MADVPSIGALGQLAIDAVTPFDTSSEPYEFVSETLTMQQTHVQSNGIRGSRSRYEHRVRIAQEAISGNIVMHASPTELDLLWPRILGGTTSMGVTDVADTLPEFQVMIDRDAKVFSYLNCQVSRAIITGQQGQPIQLTLEIEGESASIGNAGTFPALTLDTDNMFIFADVTLTLQASARPVQSFTLTIDNLLSADRYLNSVTRANMTPQDRQVTLSAQLPYNEDNTDLIDQAIAGAAGSLAISDGSTTYTFDFANVKSESTDPNIPGKQELFAPLDRMTCFADASNSECKVTKT